MCFYAFVCGYGAIIGLFNSLCVTLPNDHSYKSVFFIEWNKCINELCYVAIQPHKHRFRYNNKRNMKLILSFLSQSTIAGSILIYDRNLNRFDLCMQFIHIVYCINLWRFLLCARHLLLLFFLFFLFK